MFKLSKKTVYGLLALQHMMQMQKDKAATVREMAELYKIPQPLLAKICQQLVKSKIIQSVQGARGGYVLKAPANHISLASVVKALDGPIHLVDCAEQFHVCSRKEECTLKDGFLFVQKQIESYLQSVTLADMQKQENS